MRPNLLLLVFFVLFHTSIGYHLTPSIPMNRKSSTQLASSSRGNRDPPFTQNTYVGLQDKDDEESSDLSVSHEGNVVVKGGL